MNRYSRVFKNGSMLENIEKDYYSSPRYSYDSLVNDFTYSKIKNQEILYRECMFSLEEEFHKDLKENFDMVDNQLENKIYETSWNIVINNHERETDFFCYFQKKYFFEVYNIYVKISHLFS